MCKQLSATLVKRIAITSASSTAGLASVSAIAPAGLIQETLVVAAAVASVTSALATAAWALKTYQATRHSSQVNRIDLAQEADLPALRKIAVKYFGDKVTAVSRMKEWHTQNPSVFSMVTTETRRGRRKTIDLDGYFCVVPLRAAAAADIAAERKGINDLGADEVCTPSETPSGVYVGAVAASDKATRSAALQGLLGEVKRMARSRRDTLIMTRPVTHDGLRLVRAFGFQPVRTGLDDLTGILHVARLGDLTPLRQR